MCKKRIISSQVPNWYHTDCFFKKVRLIDVKIIKGFDDLRWEDQNKIRDLIQENSTLLSSKSKNGYMYFHIYTIY